MARYTVDFGDRTKVMDILGVLNLYATEIDKVEYPSFDVWMADMKRSGLITERR